MPQGLASNSEKNIAASFNYKDSVYSYFRTTSMLVHFEILIYNHIKYYLYNGGEYIMGNKRFESDKSTGISDGTKIITDTETGVQYLYAWSGYSGGLTLLVDKNGNPIVNKDFEK